MSWIITTQLHADEQGETWFTLKCPSGMLLKAPRPTKALPVGSRATTNRLPVVDGDDGHDFHTDGRFLTLTINCH
jgi:hypothetical protein